MDFSNALLAAKAGAKISRTGWNGSGQFVVMMPALYLPPYNTQGTERKVNDRTAKWIGADAPLDCQPYFSLYNAQGKWQPGWVPSQGDLFAVDWRAEYDEQDVHEAVVHVTISGPQRAGKTLIAAMLARQLEAAHIPLAYTTEYMGRQDDAWNDSFRVMLAALADDPEVTPLAGTSVQIIENADDCRVLRPE